MMMTIMIIFKYVEKIDEMVSLKEEKNGFDTAPCEDSIFKNNRLFYGQ